MAILVARAVLIVINPVARLQRTLGRHVLLAGLGTLALVATACSKQEPSTQVVGDGGADTTADTTADVPSSDARSEVHDGGCDFPLREVGGAEEVGGSLPASGGAALRINEVMTGNDGAWVDEIGEADDFVELVNTGASTVRLSDYWIGEKAGKATRLPAIDLAAGKTVLLWADGQPEQGSLHLPFKLSASGARVVLWSDACTMADRVEVPELPRNESYARLPDGTGDFVVCRYATPERANGASCLPPTPPNLDDNVKFADYVWPSSTPSIHGPLVLSELALRPAAFVEVLNSSDQVVTLAQYTLRLAPTAPGVAWPTALDGVALAWPADKPTLAPGERVVVPVGATDVSAVAATAEFEGVVTVFHGADEAPSDRLDFMRWPDGAALTRVPDATGLPRFCGVSTPGSANADCQPLPRRDVADRVRNLRTPHDFDVLAEGGTEVGDQAVKFVVDMQSGDAVHLLGTRTWALHYSWIRERIYKEPHLDRCDPKQAQTFNIGWSVFSQDEYYRVQERRFLLGTLVRHPNGTKTVEFTPGDAIVGEQMVRAFFAVTAHTDDPTAWKIRPTEARQIAELRRVEGKAPMVGPNAPYIGVTYQALTTTVGYGVLKFVPASELETAELGPNVIVVTDDVPNGSAFMGGLITDAFQTPLAHVNVLSRARNTPNMALRGAKDDPRIKPLLGQLVRLEVRASDFDLQVATAADADVYWQSRKPKGPRVVPPRDLSVRGLVPLESSTYASAVSVGSKAAGLAELYRVGRRPSYCPSSTLPLLVPPKAFAIPFAHYVDHFEASGARALLVQLESDPAFRADPKAHAAGLAQVRDLISKHPVDPALIAAVKAAVLSRFATGNVDGGAAPTQVRMRSSSNTEDLATFNGAGLHTSTSAEVEQTDAPIEDAIRVVWSSLWNTRAYDEREFGNIDQSQAAMGVLVHQAWLSEDAQGVAISRNALHATRSDQYYINAQIGEATVTNPAPGVTSDEIVYTPPPRTPAAEYRSRSSLSRGQDVLSFNEIVALGCALGSIHDHFQSLVDPAGENRLFAMQIEYKFLKPGRSLLIKQARPYTFGSLEVPQDCRDF